MSVWLHRAARNLVISEQRRSTVHRRWTVIAKSEERPHPRTPLQETEAQEVRAAMHDAIQRMPPRRREVLTLFYIQDLSYREVAEIMDIRPRSVANHLQAAIGELRVSLQRFFPGVAVQPEPPDTDAPPGEVDGG